MLLPEQRPFAERETDAATTGEVRRPLYAAAAAVEHGLTFNDALDLETQVRQLVEFIRAES